MPNGRTKIVHYWAAEATDAAVRTSSFVPNKEVAAIEWVSLKKARKRLSYPVDIEILDEFCRIVDEGALPTFPIVVLRHAKARSREDWEGSDTARPLTTAADARPRRSWAAARVRGASRDLQPGRALRPHRHAHRPGDRSARAVRRVDQPGRLGRRPRRRPVGDRAAGASRKPVVLASHGPVLPDILHELALATGTMSGSYLGSASALEPAAFSVVHVPVDHPGAGIVAIETHEPQV